jgi:hypothetical protein
MDNNEQIQLEQFHEMAKSKKRRSKAAEDIGDS